MKRLPIFLLIIALPAVVLIQSFDSIRWTNSLGYIAFISLMTFVANWYDKRQAELKKRRISEKNLHLLELIGGWPAAFIAQQYLRHKTSKRSYRIAYWWIVALYQYLAIEFLLDWKIARSVRALVGG